MMTRYPWIIFATACLLLSKAPSSRAADIAEIVQKAKAAIVEILTYNAKGRPLATGSGFFASPDVIITNAHVIKGAFKIFARMSNGTLYPVTVKDTRGGENVDVASLVLTQGSSNASFLYLSRPEVIAGQRVLVIGNPEGLEGTVSDGIVSAIRNGGKLIQITAAISPGSSGSPVLNEEGNVIGVATMTAREGQNLNFAISSRAILGLTCTPEEVERDRTILSKALLNFWTGKLALTQSQKKQARTIIEKFETEHDAWQLGDDTATEEGWNRRNQIYQRYYDNMSGILTPAQKKVFSDPSMWKAENWNPDRKAE